MRPIPPEVFQRAQAQLTTDTWEIIRDRFLESSWKPLAQDPKAFDAKLDQLLAQIREWMRRLHGLESRRPQRPMQNSERDQKIYEQRLRGLTFGQIGLEFKLSARVVERAFKRSDIAKKKALRHLLTFLFEAWDQASALDSQESPKPKPPPTSTT
jgi:hypothetical protein